MSFFTGVFSADGQMLSSRGADLNAAFPQVTYEEMAKDGMKMHLDLDSVPQESELRLVVRDNETGFVGSLRAPVAP